MAEERPIASNRMPGPAGPGPSAAVTLTPKEVLGILRRHMLLIIALTMSGLAIGGAGWWLIRRYLPKYTATTYIQVLSPVETDPMTIGATQLQRDILYGYRLSIANLIKQQSTLQELLGLDKVKQTDWYRRRGRNNIKAFKYLDRHFRAYAHRDSEFVEISMTCRSDKDSALIVNQMQQLFLAKQEATEKAEVSTRLARLQDRHDRVAGELRQKEADLEDVRKRFEIYDLEMPTRRYFQHTITLRLNSLELQKNDLDLAIRQLVADIKNLEELATGPVTEQIEYAIERDPVMIALAQQLALQEAQLSRMLAKFGEDHRDVRQARELIDEIRERRALRKTEIADQTRRANLENARDGLIVLQERFEELEKLRQEAEAKKKDLDRARVQYEQRLLERDERVAMLDSLKEQIEKLKIMYDAPETPKVLAVGLAPEPLEMVFSRQWYLWFPGGTMLGFLLSVALALLVELANDLVRTPSDVARFLRIPLLGGYP